MVWQITCGVVRGCGVADHVNNRKPNVKHLHAGDENRSGLQVGTVATSPLPCGGYPTLQSGGKKRSGKRSVLPLWSTCDRGRFGVPFHNSIKVLLFVFNNNNNNKLPNDVVLLVSTFSPKYFSV